LVPEDGVKNVSKKNQDTLAYYVALVFKKHNLDQHTFTEALDWYLQRHEFSDKLYTDIIDTATFFKDKYAQPKDKEREEDVELSDATQDQSVENADFGESKEVSTGRPRDKQEFLDGVSSPVDKEELDAIKQKSK